MEAGQGRVIGSGEGPGGSIGGLGVRFLVGGEASGGGFAIVEHPLAPRALAAPLHRHTREDEYSFILEGRVGARLGDRLVVGQPGDLIIKPRNEWHTFWNAGDSEARVLEIISPAGFERYFEELVALFGGGRPPQEALAEIRNRYGLETDPTSIPALIEEHGVTFG